VERAPIAVGSNINQSMVEHHHHYPIAWATPELRNSEPGPNQIWGDLEDVLPFDREHAREKYVGIEVLWRVRFSSISTNSSGGWYVFTHFDPDRESEPRHQLIWFLVSSVPGSLRTAPKGTLFWVKGKLSSIGNEIGLEPDPVIHEIERPRTPGKTSD
jgi:hypothetical protein